MSLSRCGHQTVLTSAKPHLVGLEIDPLSTDIVIYHLDVSIVVCICCYGDQAQQYGRGCVKYDLQTFQVYITAFLIYS